MKAVILAAGKGTRLQSLTKNLSKVMLPIHGKPLLERHIILLKKFGVSNIFINLHYHPQEIIEYFNNGKKWNTNIKFVLEKELKGTGGALTNFREYLDERVFLLYGDVFTDINIAKMEKFHIKNKAVLTIAVHESRHPLDSDLVLYNKKNYRLKKLLLKPHTIIPAEPVNLTGIYIIEPVLLQYLSSKTPYSFEEGFLKHIIEKEKNVFCYNTAERIEDIGTPERYKKMNKVLIA